jgi:glycosyltransferase involved in cell wall biosynthesis
MANESGIPTVSIVIIFLNGELYLREAIDSVLRQTYEDWELILVDDGSSDASVAIARQAADDHPQKIRYVQHPGHINLGMAASRNLGLHEARGRYLGYLDCDDLIFPDKLDVQVADLEAHPDCIAAFAATLFWHWGDSYEATPDFVQDLAAYHGQVMAPPAFLLDMTSNEQIHPANCSVLVRRLDLLDAGGFETSFPGMYDDTAMLAKLLLRGPVFVRNRCVAAYRLHQQSFCHQAERDGVFDQTRINAARQHYLEWLRRYSAGFDAAPLIVESVERELAPRPPAGTNPLRQLYRQGRKTVRRLQQAWGRPLTAGQRRRQTLARESLRTIDAFFEATGREDERRELARHLSLLGRPS